MNSATDKLADAIDQLVREKTFNLDALDAIRGLKDKASAQDAKIEKLTSELAAARQQSAGYYTDLAEERSKAQTVTDREAAVTLREAKVSELEKNTAVAQAQSAAYLLAFGMVFKNTVVRETTMENIALSGQPNYSPQWTSVPKMTTRETE